MGVERFEGMTLPAVVSQTTFGTVLILSERIVLNEGGSGLRFTTSRSVDDVTPQGAEFSYTQALHYVVRGSRVEMTMRCPPNADCIAGPHLVGEAISGGLALARPYSSRPASIYKRRD